MNENSRNQHFSGHRHRPAHFTPSVSPPGNSQAGLSNETVRSYIVDALRSSLPNDITQLLNEVGYAVPLPKGLYLEEIKQWARKFRDTEPGQKFYRELREQAALRRMA